MDGPSQAYFEALDRTRAHHAGQEKTFSGQFTWKLRHRIKDLIDRVDAASLLDYGCGKGKQYNRTINHEADGRSLMEFWGITPVMYDPGVVAFSREPIGTWDVVICVQVLGSIPASDLPWVIDRLYGYATKGVFVAERIKLPRKQIFAGMEDEMPRGFSVERWMELLRRPGSPIRLVAAFHNADPDIGWPGWRVEEPPDQG